MSSKSINFEEFWPIYVRAHATKSNRTLHVIGTSLALACLLAAILKRKPWLVLLAPVAGYGFGWCGHLIAGNRPTSSSHPLLSIRANLLLWWKTLAGEMEEEVARILADDAVEIETPGAAAQVSSHLN
jgi:hypothetical protein